MSEVKVNKISPRTACGTVTVGDSGDAVCVSAGVPVTVQGDLKSPALKATDGGVIISQSGTDITIGASGDTVALASGASQTGFGRTGTVDWVTTPKVTGDSPVTAATGSGYFLNTTAGEITINLPAGAAGSIVSMADYAATWQTNKVTVAANGSEKIGGLAEAALLNTEGQSVTLVYVDSTQGWINTMDSTSNVRGTPLFVTASGGNQPTAGGCIVCTNYKIHKFTGPGTFCVSCAGNPGGSATVDYMVVAGGGGSRCGNVGGAGGGGAGGWRASSGAASGCYTAGPAPLTSPAAAIAVPAAPYAIAIGGGGATGTASDRGGNSIFSTITSTGGGSPQPTSTCNVTGGSGGGGSNGTGSAGNTPETDPDQGNDGGNGTTAGTGSTTAYVGGGGGGATAVGGNGAIPGGAGVGGTGSTSCISATPTAYSGGGGGASGRQPSGTPVPGGAGGTGGGGAGGNSASGTAGTINTGGGGGGGGYFGPAGTNPGALGGSGIVYIRYKFQ